MIFFLKKSPKYSLFSSFQYQQRVQVEKKIKKMDAFQAIMDKTDTGVVERKS